MFEEMQTPSPEHSWLKQRWTVDGNKGKGLTFFMRSCNPLQRV